MAKLLRPRQFNRTFSRSMESYVQTVEQRSHGTGEGTMKLWRNISFFVGFPCILLGMVNSYMRHLEERNHERPEFVPYSYLKIMNKKFPWGDGKHSLFHNPKTNYVPGIGYEA